MADETLDRAKVEAILTDVESLGVFSYVVRAIRWGLDRDAAFTAAALPDVGAKLRAVMVDPSDCPYCEGSGWCFNDKSYDGYPHGRGPYVEPDDLNGGYSPCPRCNDDREVDFGSGDKVAPWRKFSDAEVAEIVAALGTVPEDNGGGGA